MWRENSHAKEPLDTSNMSETFLDLQAQPRYQLTAADLMTLVQQQNCAVPNPDPYIHEKIKWLFKTSLEKLVM